MVNTKDVADGLEDRIRQHAAAAESPLELKPIRNLHARPSGRIPNTPMAVSVISALMGVVFALGGLIFFAGGFQRYWWATYQLGFYVASWAFFHWAEFAITAGWNREKCSVDCRHLISTCYNETNCVRQHSYWRMGRCIISLIHLPLSNISFVWPSYRP